MFAELPGGIGGLGKILLRPVLCSPTLAVDGHEDVDHQRHQGLVGADIRGRFLAADVLFARGQGKTQTTLAVAIVRSGRQAARASAGRIFRASRSRRSTGRQSQRNAERLRFHGDNVGLARRLDDAQRNRFGNRDHQHGAFLCAISAIAATSSIVPKKFGD